MTKKVDCWHKNKKSFKSFRVNYTHGRRGRPSLSYLPKKVTVKCMDCKRKLYSYKPKR